MSRNCKIFGELIPGDKLYKYTFSGGCHMTELEIESISEPNECNCRIVSFKDQSPTTRMYLHISQYIKIDNYCSLTIYSTNKNFRDIFMRIFNEGVNYTQYMIKSALGMND